MQPITHGVYDFKREIVSAGASYPTDSLWSIWRFNDSVEDEYSTHDLTNSPASYESGSIPSSYAKSAATFSGSVPTITDNVFMPVGAALSLSMWIYPKSAGPFGRICGCAGNSYGRCAISITIDANLLYWGKERSGYFGSIKTTSFTLRDQWVHIVQTTADGNTWKFYINGTKQSEATNTTNLNYNVFFVGNITPGNGNNYLTNCKLASMFVYTKELSQTEVNQLYNSGSGV